MLSLSNHLFKSRENLGNGFALDKFQVSKELENALNSKNILQALKLGIGVDDYNLLQKCSDNLNMRCTKALLSY